MSILLSPRFWIAVGLALALAATHGFVYKAGRAAVRNQWDADRLLQAENRILADRAQQAETTRRQAVTDREALNATLKNNSLEAALRRARAAGDGLRDAALGAASRARADSCAAATGPGQPDSDAAGMLAIVLGRVDERAGILAEHADRLAIAAAACERIGDGLTGVAAP